MVRMMRVRMGVRVRVRVRVRDRVLGRCNRSTTHHAYPMTMTPLADMGCCLRNTCVSVILRLSPLYEPNELLDHVLNDLRLARGWVHTFCMLP